MRGRLPVALAGLVAACSVTLDTQSLGDMQDQPLALLGVRGETYELELTKPTYISVLTMRPGHDRYPVVFRPVYPQRPGDQWQFPAGVSRVPPVGSARGQPFNPRWCQNDEVPTLGGCRYRNGVPVRFEIAPAGVEYAIILAADQRIDPFRAAYELTVAVYEDDVATLALRSDDRTAVRRALEQALANRQDVPFWSAIMVRR